MKKLLFLCVCLMAIACSKDDHEDATASLKVIVIDSNGAFVSGARITTSPATNLSTTNSQGVAIINKVPLGEYTIKVHVLNDPLNYPTTVSITQAKEYKKTIITVAAPNPVEEQETILTDVVKEAYGMLTRLGIFNAAGFVFRWGALGTDAVHANREETTWFNMSLDTYQIDKNNPILNRTWNDNYAIVLIVNDGLDQMAKIERDLTKKELSQIAELKFIRALIYFNLTKMYGNPLIIEHYNPGGDLSDIQQGGKEAYDLIIRDLKFSKENLNEITSNTIASKEAAIALLGKVYLQSAGFPLLITENYNKALDQFEELEGRFSLVTEYSNLFNPEVDSENEILFKVDFDSSIGIGGDYGALWGPLGYSIYDRLKLSPNTIDDYFEGSSVPVSPVTFPIEVPDTRFYQNIATFKVESGEKINLENTADWRPYKYVKDVSEPVQWGQQDFDFIILRYADVLLMKAEAINEISGPNETAYALINQIRRRAYGDNEHDLVKGLTKEEFRKALLIERKKEFFMEGHRKDDLVRMQALETVIKTFNQHPDVSQKDYQSHEYIWPISQSQIENNPYIEQNYGY